MPWFGDLEGAYASWRRLGCRAQILGPHGTGKSTLLTHLVARAARDGIRFAALDDASVRHPLVVAFTRWRHRRVLVTTHRDLGFPTLCDTSVSLGTARAIVGHLLREHPFPVPDEDTLRTLLATHSGNFREVLFALYDAVERGAPA